jgi:hypothetical protein
VDELINMLSSKLGLPPDKAAIAVQLVVNHIKSKAPALSGPINSLMGGATGSAGGPSGIGDIANKLGGLMGGKG